MLWPRLRITGSDPILPVVPHELIGSYWWIAITQLVLLGAAATWTTLRATTAARRTVAGLVAGFVCEASALIVATMFIGAVTDVDKISAWNRRRWIIIVIIGILNLALTLVRPYLLTIASAALLASLVTQPRERSDCTSLLIAKMDGNRFSVRAAIWHRQATAAEAPSTNGTTFRSRNTAWLSVTRKPTLPTRYVSSRISMTDSPFTVTTKVGPAAVTSS